MIISSAGFIFHTPNYEGFKDTHDAFLNDVFHNEDVDLVRIIKIHLYCEYWINKLILAKVKIGKK